MRKLLLFFAFVLTAIGVKAYELDLTKTWTVDGANEKVAKISLANAGELSAALADLNGQMTDYSHLYISNGAGFDLAAADITALGTVTCPTLDLQNLYGTGGGHHAPFTFSNASIKRVILPDYWDKAAVKAAAEKIIASGNTGFEAALSQHGQQNQSTADAKLVAYVQKPGTLYTAMRHTYFDGRADKKMGNATKDYCAFDKLGYVSIMGYPSALDFNGNDNTAGVKFDPNGHFVFDREADETSVSANAGIGGTRALTGTAHNGAITGAALIQLDLGDAVIYEEWCNDITLSWSYAQGDAVAEYITFLHYPRECGTPEIQRYTDPTREYSVATTWRDGKGNVVYFPNQSEFNRAYIQGTTGYLWYAWYSERVPEPAGNANSFKNANPSTSGGHTTDLQQTANDLYIANTMEDPDKTDRSFYDVRLDPTGQPTLTKPADLKWYYNTIWEDKQLYPKPETVGVVDEQGNPVMETVPVYDANGNIIYDPAAAGATYEGNYIRNEVDVYVKASDGEYCHQLVANGEGQYTIGYSYTQDDNGDFIKNSQGNYEAYYSWMDTNPSYQGCKRYTRKASGLIKFTDQWGAPRFNLSTDYVLYETYDSEYKTLLDRYNKVIDYEFTEATSSDAGPFWTMRTEIAQAQEVTKKRDYRGWHQFVLHAYDTNDEHPLTPVKFYQSDPDWWTVCLPYDLKYSEMVRFFGNGEGKIPYLSKLRYVVRDYDKEKITLMFSKNLMVYKEEITNPSNNDDYVHGVIDDVTTYTDAELQADPIILHKGVPYLIKPNIPEGANRSFDVFKTETPDLYKRLIDSQNVPAAQLETYIYKGEYTVPAYVIGDTDKEETVASRTFTHTEVGPSFTYNSSDKIMYGGKEVEAKISKDFSYTFVGSFFLSVLPQYCYFLGWDSKNSRAAFWYNRVPNLVSQDWNNQTGIICPNFNTSKTIDPATSLSDPARWILAASDVKNDDLVGVASGAKKSLMDMDFGSIDVVVSGIGQINLDRSADKAVQEDVIYDLRGVRMNRPLSRLTKGVYIVNGKKYVVD